MSLFVKKSLLLAIAFLLLPINLSAEPVKKSKNHEISTNANILFLQLPITYRFKIADHVAMGIYARGGYLDIEDFHYSGFGVDIGPKFFLSGEAFTTSWYFEPTIGLAYRKMGIGKITGYNWIIGPSLLFGHGWVFDSGFSINLGLGLSYSYAFGTGGYKGILPTGDFSVGWTF